MSDQDGKNAERSISTAMKPSPDLPEGISRVRIGPGANCSSAGSAIDVLFYGSVLAAAVALALSAAFAPKDNDLGNETSDKQSEND